jgi:ribonucleotide reductase alpha subunit
VPNVYLAVHKMRARGSYIHSTSGCANGLLPMCSYVFLRVPNVYLAMHKVRARGSYIHSKSGCANGLVPMLRVFNATARLCDQVTSSSYDMHV